MSYNREAAAALKDRLADTSGDFQEPELQKPSEGLPPEEKEALGRSIKTPTKDKANESVANLCGVCFSMEPDSVFMKCGHGGICYECAVDIWKSTGECYLCRDEIEQILQVEPEVNEAGEEILKVVASTQMVAEDEEYDPDENVEYVN